MKIIYFNKVSIKNRFNACECLQLQRMAGGTPEQREARLATRRVSGFILPSVCLLCILSHLEHWARHNAIYFPSTRTLKKKLMMAFLINGHWTEQKRQENCSIRAVNN